MTYSFLERRVDDQVKEAAVRMQKVIVGIFLLCFIGRMSCLVFNLGSGFLRWTFFVYLIEWLVLAIGFFGAKRRNGSLLTSYIVCVILWVVFSRCDDPSSRVPNRHHIRVCCRKNVCTRATIGRLESNECPCPHGHRDIHCYCNLVSDDLVLYCCWKS